MSKQSELNAGCSGPCGSVLAVPVQKFHLGFQYLVRQRVAFISTAVSVYESEY